MRHTRNFLLDPRSLVVVLLITCSHLGFSQSRTSAKDSLKLVVKELRHRMLVADSTGSAALGAELRVSLSREVKSPEAIKLLQQAVDTLHQIGPRNTEIAVRSELAEALREAGKAPQAYSELLQVRSLIEARERDFGERAGMDSVTAVARSMALNDSLSKVNAQESAVHEASIKRSSELLRTWQWATLGIALLWLVSMALLLYRTGRLQRRSIKAIEELQVKVRALEQRPVNVQRVPKEESLPLPVVKEIPSAVKGVADQIDPMILGMFRRQAPERLETLKAARDRGDSDKVVRVVHSLKPQLVAIDAGRYTPLCTAITSAEARVDQAKFDRTLDEFQVQVERTLRELKD